MWNFQNYKGTTINVLLRFFKKIAGVKGDVAECFCSKKSLLKCVRIMYKTALRIGRRKKKLFENK